MGDAAQIEAAARASRIGDVLFQRGQTLSVVETSAGGALSQAITSVSGSSRWYVGGIVAYSVASRVSLLGIEVTPQGGAVSIEHAIALATGGRRRLETDWCIAETGIAGPVEGRRSAKAAGTVYVAVVGKREGGDIALWREHSSASDDRILNQHTFALAALELLADALMA